MDNINEKDKNDNNNLESSSVTIHKGLGYRHQQCLLLFIAVTVAYSIRSCMGVALVAMNAPPHDNFNATQNITDYVRYNISEGANWNFTRSITEDAVPDGVLHALLFARPYPVFEWSKRAQDTLQSAFYWGYMLLQVPAGMLAHRFGCRYMLVFCMFGNGIIFFIMPWIAYYGGWVPVAVCRCVQGLCQSCVFPSCHTFLGKWAPLRERSRMTAAIYGGTALGTVLGLPITGFLASSSWGWPGIFRFYGVLSLIPGCMLWLFLADTPSKHPKISAAEQFYIERELGDGTTKLTVPWRRILRSPGMWAIVGAHAGQTWGQLTTFAEVPAYMNNILGVSIKTNGLLTALPFFVMFLSNIAFSFVADEMIVRKWLSVTNTRKLANSVSCVLAALGLVLLGFAPKNIWIVEFLLIFICAFKIAAHMGFQTINIDMAPNFSGTLMSISNFVANGIGSFAPLTAGFILKDEPNNPARWRQVFLLVAGIYLVSNLVFVVFATGERQSWNEPAGVKPELNTILTHHQQKSDEAIKRKASV